MKETEGDTNWWKGYAMFMDWKNQRCWNDYTAQGNLKIQCNLHQITQGIFHRTRRKKVPEFVWRHRRPQIAKVILRKKKQSWRNQASWLWAILQTTVIKTVWYWHKNRNIDQGNKIENPEISPCTYGQLIHDKGAKTTQYWKDSLSPNGTGKAG